MPAGKQRGPWRNSIHQELPMLKVTADPTWSALNTISSEGRSVPEKTTLLPANHALNCGVSVMRASLIISRKRMDSIYTIRQMVNSRWHRLG